MSDTPYIQMVLDIPAGTTTYSIQIPVLNFIGKITWGDGSSNTYTTTTNNISKGYTRSAAAGTSTGFSVVITFSNVTRLDSINLLLSPSGGNSGSITNYRTGLREFSYLKQITSFTNMTGLFYNAINITTVNFPSTYQNEDITSRLNNVTNMASMFQGASSLVACPIGSMKTTNVTNMSNMFNGATSFNQNLNNGFDTSNVTTMTGMFQNATSFNQEIIFNTNKVTDMLNMFNGATAFQGPFTSNGGSVLTNTSNIFLNVHSSYVRSTNIELQVKIPSTGATIQLPLASTSFIGRIEWGDGTNITSTFNTFVNNLSNFTKTYPATSSETVYTIKLVDVFRMSSFTIADAPSGNSLTYRNSLVSFIYKKQIFTFTNLSALFNGCSQFTEFNVENSNITTNVTNMSKMFRNCTLYTGNFPSLQCNSLTNISYMFENATNFNSQVLLENSNINNASGLFKGAENFNNNIKFITNDSLNTFEMFSSAKIFNQPLSNIYATGNVSPKITNTSFMFRDATNFNQPFLFNTIDTTTMESMFQNAGSFNQSNIFLNTSKVTSMANMFKDATEFNGIITFSDTSKVTTFAGMFQNASSYNQDIILDLTSATTINNLFNGAISFSGKYTFNNVGPNLTTMTNSFLNVAQRRYTETDSYIEITLDLSVNSLNGVQQSISPPVNQSNFIGVIDWGDGTFNSIESLGTTSVSKTYSDTFAAENPYVIIKFYDVFRMLSYGTIEGVANTTTSRYAACVTEFKYLINIPSFTNYSRLFNQHTILETVDFNGINTNSCTNMTSMFRQAAKFNSSLYWLTTPNVTNMSYMFSGASKFNQSLVHFTTSKVTTMSNMFQDAIDFNQPINFDLSSCKSINKMFSASGTGIKMSFNSNINFTNTTNITNAAYLFQYNKKFNKPVTLNIPKVFSSINANGSINTGIVNMFDGATEFNSPVNLTINSSLTSSTNPIISLAEMFLNASSFNSSLTINNPKNVTRMNSMFEGAKAFNQSFEDIFNNNTTKVTNMSRMFFGATSFNQYINFRTDQATDISYMFACNDSITTGPNPTFGPNFSNNLTKVVGQISGSGGPFGGAMGMFSNNKSFNNDVSFNLTACTNLISMFLEAKKLDANIRINLSTGWINISLQSLFSGCTSFGKTSNSSLTFNSTQNVISMRDMFLNCKIFNLPISFDTSKVVNMSSMFQNCSNFNQPLNFDTSNVSNFSSMFQNAVTFNQPINFNLNNLNVSANGSNFLSNTGISINTYGRILNNLNNSSVTNKVIGVNGLKYNDISLQDINGNHIPTGKTSRTELVNKGWSFTGDESTDLVETLLTFVGSKYIEKLSTDASFQLEIEANVDSSSILYDILDLNNNILTNGLIASVDASGVVTINGSGEVYVRGRFLQTNKNTSASTILTLSISKVPSDITINSLVNNSIVKNITDLSYNVIATSNNNELPIQYEVIPNDPVYKLDEKDDIFLDASGNPVIDYIVPNNVSINSQGKITFTETLGFSSIRVYQTETTNSKYASTEQIFIFYVKKIPTYQVDTSYNLYYSSILSKSNTNTSSTYKFITDSNGNLQFSSSNPNIAHVNNITDGTIEGITAGIAIITLAQTETDTYFASQTSFIINVLKAPTILTIVDNIKTVTKLYNSPSFSIFTDVSFLDTNTESNLYDFSVGNTNIANIDDNGMITVKNAGETPVNIFIPESTNYLRTNDVSFNLVINRILPTITGEDSITKIFSKNVFNLASEIHLSSNNTQTGFTYQLVNSSDASFISLDPSGNISIQQVTSNSIQINIFQIETSNFLQSNNKTVSLTLNKAQSVIDLSANSITKKFNDSIFNLRDALDISSNNTEKPILYQTSDASSATIDGSGNVNILKVGTGSVTFTISQEGTNNYIVPISKSITMTINRDTPVLDLSNNEITKCVGESFNLQNLLNITSNNKQTSLVYQSSDPLTAYIDYYSSHVIVHKTGTITFTVSQVQTDDYLPISLPIIMNIERGFSIIDLSTNSITKTYGESNFNITSVLDNLTTTNSETAFSYQIEDASYATIDTSNNITILKAGTTKIIISQEQTTNYLQGSKDIPLIINRATPNIRTISNVITKTYGDSIFNISTDISSNNTITGFSYYIDSSNASIDTSGNITILKVGTSNVIISQGETTNYLPGFISITLIINKSPNSIRSTATSFSRTFGSGSFNLNNIISISSDNKQNNFTYNSSDILKAEIDGSGNITMRETTINSNDVDIPVVFTISQEGTDNYDIAIPIQISMTINKSTSSIYSNTNTTLISRVFGSGNFNLINNDAYDLSSNNPESNYIFTPSDPSFATIDASGNVTMLKSTTSSGLTITVSKSASKNYLVSNNLILTLIINQATASITASDSISANFNSGTVDLIDAADISSNHLESSLTYSSLDPSYATINNSGIVTLVSSTLSGQPARLIVSQGLSTNYNATEKTIFLTINKAASTISSTNPSKTFTFLDPSFNILTAYGITSTNPGSFIYDLSGSSAITISPTNIATILSASPNGFSINITQPESTNYLASNKLTITMIINKKAAPITVQQKSSYTFPTISDIAPLTGSYSSNTITWRTTPFYTNFNIYDILNINSINTESNTVLASSLNISRATAEIINGILTGKINITPNAAGNAGNITISKAESPNYLAASFTLEIGIGRAQPILTFSTRTLNNIKVGSVIPFSAFGFSSSNGASINNITFSNINGLVLSVNNTNDTITVLRRDVISNPQITVTHSNVGTYLGDRTLTNWLTINLAKGDATIDLSANIINKIVTDPSFNLRTALNIRSNNTVTPFTYSTSDASSATIDASGNVNILRVGTTGEVIFTISQGESPNYNAAANKTVTMNISRATANIDLSANIINKTVTDPSFNLETALNIRSNHNEKPITYSSSDASSATIDASGNVNILRVGTTGKVTFTISQAESPNYNAAANKTVTMNIAKAPNIISSRFNSITKKYNDTSFNLLTTYDISSNHLINPFNFFTDSSAIEIDSYGNIFIRSAVDDSSGISITVSQPGTDYYLDSVNKIINLVINKDNAIIDLSSNILTKKFTVASFNLQRELNIRSNHKESLIKYTSSDLSYASIDDNGDVIILKSTLINEPVVFTASQIGTTNYLPTSQQIFMTVEKTETIVKTNEKQLIKKYGDSSFNLKDIMDISSNNIETNFIYASSDMSYVTIDLSGNVNILKSTIDSSNVIFFTVSQIQTDNYLSSSRQINIVVEKISPILSYKFDKFFDIITRKFGNGPFSLIDATNFYSSNNETTFIFSSSNETYSYIDDSSGIINILSANDVSFNISQIETTNYLSMNKTFIMEVDPQDSYILIDTDKIDRIFGIDNSFNLISELDIETSNNETSLEFSSSDPSSVTIDGSGYVNIIKTPDYQNGQPSKIYLNVFQQATNNYAYDLRNIELTVKKQPTIIDISFNTLSRVYGSGTFNINAVSKISSNNKESTFNYTSLDPSYATIDEENGIVSLIRPTLSNYPARLIVSQNDSTNYTASDMKEITLNINRVTTLIDSSNNLTKTFGDNIFNLITDYNITSNNPDSLFTYQVVSSDASAVSIDSSGNVTILKALDSPGLTIVVSQEQSDNYTKATKELTLIIKKANNSISLSSTSTSIQYLSPSYNSPFDIRTLTDISSNNSINNYTFSSNNTSLAEIDNLSGIINIKGVGSAIITIGQPSTLNYNAAISKTFTLNITRAFNEIRVATDPLITNFGVPEFDLKTAIDISSNNIQTPNIYSYNSLDTTTAIIDSTTNLVNILKANTDGVDIIINQAETSLYLSASKTINIKVNKSSNNIIITKPSSISKTFNSELFNIISAYGIDSSHNQSDFTFTSSNELKAEIDLSGNITMRESTIDLNGVDNPVVFTISQGGSDNYLAAEPIQVSLTINKAENLITLNETTITKTFTDASFNLLTAYGIDSSHNESNFIFTSSNTSKAEIDLSGNITMRESTIDLNGVDTPVVFTISQGASNNYLAAEPIEVSLTINKAENSITSTETSISKKYTDDSFNLISAYGIDSSHNECNFIFTSSNDLKAEIDPSGNITIHESTIDFNGVDNPVFFTISQPESTNYLKAESKTVFLTINKVNNSITSINSNYNKQFDNVPFSIIDIYEIDSSHNETNLIFSSNNSNVLINEYGYITILQTTIDNIIFTISQPESTNYLAGQPIEVSLTINKSENSITSTKTSISKKYTDNIFNIITAYGIDSSHNESNFIFTSSNTSKAEIDLSGNITIRESTIDFNGVDTPVVFTILQGISNNYLAAEPIEVSLTIEKASNTILSDKPEIFKVYSNNIFNINSSAIITSKHRETDYIFTSSDASFATIDTSGNITLLKSTINSDGSNNPVIITISQNESTNYLSATPISILLTINKITSTISKELSSKIEKFGSLSFNLLTTYKISSNNIETDYIFTSSDASFATIDTSGNISIIKSTFNIDGSNNPVIFTITKPETTNYTRIVETVSLTIEKANNNISSTFNEITKTYGDGVFNLGTLLNINSKHMETNIEYSSLDPSYATIYSNGDVTIKQSTYDLDFSNNPVRFIVTQASSTNYLSASKEFFMTINKASNEIKINNSDVIKTFNDASFNLLSDYNITSNHNETNFIYSSSDPSSATIDSNGIVTILKSKLTPGVIFTIRQPVSFNYLQSIKEITIPINRATTVIDSSNNLTKTFGANKFNLIADYNITSNNPESIFTYHVASSDASAVSIDSSGNVTILQAKPSPGLTIAVSQAQSNNYTQSTKQITLIINRAETTISSLNNEITKTYGENSFDLKSELDISANHIENTFTYSSLDPSYAIIDSSSGIVTILRANDNVRLLVTKSETTNYLAQSKEIKLIINKTNTIIDSSSNLLSKTYSKSSFDLINELNISTNNNDTSFSYESLDPSFATIDTSGNVTMIKAGIARFNISQISTNNYNPSTKEITIIINQVNTVINANTLVNTTYGEDIIDLNSIANITSNNNETSFLYEHLDPSYARIDENGFITIIRKGTAKFNVSQIGTDNYIGGTKMITMEIGRSITTIDISSNIFTKVFGDLSFNILNELNIISNNNETNFDFISLDSSSAIIDTSGYVTILKSNTSGLTIRISKIQTENYLANSIDITLVIEKQKTIIQYESDIELEYVPNNQVGLYIPQWITLTSNNTDSLLSYNVQDESIVEVNENQRLIIKSAGSTFITISQEETDNFTYGEVIINVDIYRKESTITHDILKTVTFGDTFNILTLFNITTDNIGGNYSFSYVPSGFIDIDPLGNVSITKASPSSPIQITVSISQSNNYTSASTLPLDLYINKKSSILTANKSSLTNYIDSSNYIIFNELIFTNTNPENFNYSFSSTNTLVATINDFGIINIDNYTTGNTNIIITSTATENYTSATLSIPLTVVQKLLSNMKINTSNIINHSYADGDFYINNLITIDTSNNETTIKYESLNTNIAYINTYTGYVNVLLPGTVTIRAYQTTTPTYAADDELITLNIAKLPNTISLNKSETTKNLIDNSFNLINEYNITTNNSQDTIIFTTTSTKINILQDGTVNMLEGTLNEEFITITVSQTSNIYQNVSTNLQLKINPQLETNITAGNSNNVRVNYNLDGSFNVIDLYEITSNSDASYSFESLNTDYLTINDLGIATILNARPDVPVKIKVNKLESTFYKFKTVTLDLYIDKFVTNIISDASGIVKVFNTNMIFDLISEYGVISNNNIIPFTYESLDMSYATINSNGIVTILRATIQPITLRVSQLGNDNYTTYVKELTLTVNKYTTVITINNTDELNKTYRTDTEFNLFNEYGIQSNNNIPFTFEYSGTQYISINSAGLVSILNANTNSINITIRQLDDENNNGSFIQVSLVINKYQPSITAGIASIRKIYKADNNFNLLTTYQIQSDVERNLIPYTFIFDSSYIQIDPSATVNIIRSSPFTPIKLEVKQLENNNYKEGKLNLDLFIDKKNPDVNIPLLNINKQEGDEPFNLGITSENDESLLIYNTSNINVISVNNTGLVTINNDGSSNIIVTQNESVNYNGINNIIINVNVSNNSSSTPLKIDNQGKIVYTLKFSKSSFVGIEIKNLVLSSPATNINTITSSQLTNATTKTKKFTALNQRSRIISRR